MPAFSATGHDHLISWPLEVAQQIAPIAIAHQGSRRDLNDQVFTAAPEVTVSSDRARPARPSPVALVREGGPGSWRLSRGTNDDAIAVKAVSAMMGPPARRIPSPEAQAAVAARLALRHR